MEITRIVNGEEYALHVLEIECQEPIEYDAVKMYFPDSAGIELHCPGLAVSFVTDYTVYPFPLSCDEFEEAQVGILYVDATTIPVGIHVFPVYAVSYIRPILGEFGMGENGFTAIRARQARFSLPLFRSFITQGSLLLARNKQPTLKYVQGVIT